MSSQWHALRQCRNFRLGSHRMQHCSRHLQRQRVETRNGGVHIHGAGMCSCCTTGGGGGAANRGGDRGSCRATTSPRIAALTATVLERELRRRVRASHVAGSGIAGTAPPMPSLLSSQTTAGPMAAVSPPDAGTVSPTPSLLSSQIPSAGPMTAVPLAGVVPPGAVLAT